ncbi:Crp/Fnr family transcriptional regulator [Parapedobacter koreensis]|uniref:cAMP-binding domain of CRP or a regulatory subunit of cAMP-dependent protein kinases n=1 Tax=Parapedobacter koreensis TaxID=332977 RepID=A0A1H7MIZ0_9SPHI|nr:Crp/Fnr family transcriptional regulator [Parapedobacter koreensis]SEL11039.1 cAMP-binding domain of CRP or a regulatory subunit of cAMP-dependent protein kinases [Parapedobacter koreensis]
MNEFAPIISNVSRFIDLTAEETQIFISHLRIVIAKKKQFIVQPGFVCQYRSYVLKGALRTYLLANDGQEHTIALSIEDWWTSDFASYITQEPATLFVEATEDATLIQLSHKDEQELYKLIPKFERFFRLQVERSGVSIQKRMLSSLSKTAEERYDELINRNPQFLQRFPQYVIASYLGMTTQFLSRIRKLKARS